MSKIKAIIFDLDDTLFDQEQIRDLAREQSIKVMIEKGLKCSIEQAMNILKEITPKTHTSNRFKELIKYFDCYDNEIAKIGMQTYITSKFDKIDTYPEAKEVLKKLKQNYKLILITEGISKQQNKKIDLLGIKEFFNYIFTVEPGTKKNQSFLQTMSLLNLTSNEIIVVGDRLDKEIKAGNEVGIKTIRLLKGIYSSVQPQEPSEKPDFTINNLTEIIQILDNLNNFKKKLKIITIGGGTGVPTILEGLRKYTDDLVTITTVTDSGRSSGRLRKELNLLPPGDIRNCLIALSNSEKLMCDLFQYRFDNGLFEGHSFGNLLIAALTKLTGSFEKAIEETSKILKLKGKVLASTFDNAHICAELQDNNLIEQEDNIIERDNKYVHLRPKIKKVFLKPEAKANPEAIKQIQESDLIIICPGSLFTSIISNLLVQEIPEAINKSKAKKIYICNIMTQPSQTHNYKASDHIKQIIKYLKEDIEYIILNTQKPDGNLLQSYKQENAYLVENDLDNIKKLYPNMKIITKNLLDDIQEKKLLWEKKDLLRHNPDKIAEVLINLLGDNTI